MEGVLKESVREKRKWEMMWVWARPQESRRLWEGRCEQAVRNVKEGL